MITVAVIGGGGWGKNHVRNFHEIKTCRLKTVCDLNEKVLGAVKTAYPAVGTTPAAAEVFADREVDAVVIATDAPTHYRLACDALAAGKHVFVEKPMTLAPADSEDLVARADAAKKVLMVGHLLEYHPCVLQLKDLVDKGQLGALRYLYCQRVNLGVIRKDENAWWSLAPHDVSIILFILQAEPVTVTAQGQAYLRPGVEDVVFAQLKFADGRMAHIHVSWFDPHKIRKVTLVGSDKMATFDDMDASEKIRIYDKGVNVSGSVVDYEQAIHIRSGDILIPKTPGGEPLRSECLHFLECIEKGRTPRSDGRDGLRVVRVLEAAGRSLAAGGAPITL
ncbi:MAG TPA: Gfo/Idh/MocA family oxidoreductase [Phycisphaerae bacterium]|nr:Gfo/Idh/MocA family oxidoreductase [Phycisphaerae bacterium]